ncbi:MAG: gluconate 2-dehydrogenase subunit 3 family protein [Paracoccaceae bacterium]
MNKELLTAILDELIPPSADGRVPGAGTLGVAAFFADARRYVPDPVGSAQVIADAVTARTPNFETLDGAKKIAVLKAVEQDHPEPFNALVQLTYMGYYSRPETRALFGVGVHPVHPVGYAVERESEELLAELTSPVRARGTAFRNA